MLIRGARRRAVTLAAGTLMATVALAAPAAPADVGVFQVQSGGYGHGVGMSQYGADGYALHGVGYRSILAHYFQGTALGAVDPNQTVRVQLTDSGQPTFSGASSADGSVRLRPGTSYTVKPRADGTLVLAFTGTHKGRPVAKQLGPFSGTLTVTGPVPLQLANTGTYHGAFEFHAAGNGVETINALALDDYVNGVVGAEVPSNWPAAALEAQAVAARTYALTADAGGTAFNVFDDTRSQMYLGVGAETASTRAAVAATSGQVVTYHGAPVITYFFSSSGGHTESVQNVFHGAQPEPWLVGVPDPFDSADGHDPYDSVTRVMSLGDAAGKLNGLYRGALVGVRVLRHGVSPRVISAEVVGTHGSSVVSGDELQNRFGLRTDWEVFTSVSAGAGAAPGGSGKSPAQEAASAAQAARQGNTTAGAQTSAVRALVPLVDSMLVEAIPGLHGTVYPPPPGVGRVSVELRQGRSWQAVSTASLGQGGVFDVALPGTGTYRVRYRHLVTPPVTIG